MKELKKCGRCKLDKCESEYKLGKSGKLNSYCIVCKSDYDREYRLKNNKSDKFKESSINRQGRYYEKNRESILLKKKEYRLKNKELIAKAKKIWDSENLDRRREYYHENSDRINSFARKRKKHRRKTDNLYRFIQSARNFCKKINKGGSKTEEILGCSFDEALIIIETRDHTNGSLERETDHIIPLSWASNEDEGRRLCHVSNLQYLSRKDNASKNSRLFPKYFTNEVLERFSDIIYRYLISNYGKI
tara:strand:- start:8344 stop:9084 length:741 start_codon:yes stop_codon:yes gene_type:complete